MVYDVKRVTLISKNEVVISYSAQDLSDANDQKLKEVDRSLKITVLQNGNGTLGTSVNVEDVK
ncbi:MAG: hypothetical protein H7061_01655 [Bdellovibrionaceae bacterium]|nr:hypothetical protein [Bdellovibrio sp.]